MKRTENRIVRKGMLFFFMTSISFAYVLLNIQWPIGTDVGFYINPNTAQVSDEAWAVYDAAETWSSINPSALKLSYWGTSSVTTYAYNGSNTVCWNNEGPSGALATAWMWSVGGTFLETDMVFNDYYSWSTSGGDYDVETVALHEFGHWVGLGHSSSGIMTASYSGIQRTIDSDAMAGFEAIYGGVSLGPTIQFNKASLDFFGAGIDSFSIRNSGDGILIYQLASNQSWLSVSPNFGESSGEWDLYQVSVDTSGLSLGDYSGSIVVTSSDATNSPQSLDIDLTVPDDRPPTINITSPSNNSIVTGIVKIKAKASDDNGIIKVEFFVDNKKKKSVFSSPYEWEWNPTAYPSGFHTIVARAYDTISQTSDASIKLKVDKPPEITLISPESGVDISGTVIVKATATDDFGVSNVRFYINNVLKKTDTAAPYDYLWDTSFTQNGNYEVKAEVRDSINQTKQSAINNYVVPHSPENLDAVRRDNSSVLLEEYINVLTWQPNAIDQGIIGYRVYRMINGIRHFLGEVSGTTFEFWHRNVDKEGLYSYVVTAVDGNNKEGVEASVDINKGFFEWKNF